MGTMKIVMGILVGAVVLATQAGAETVTYTRDVAPIFFENCAVCHRPGEVAPMSLLTYQEARPWAKSIAKAVRGKIMPPWSGESEHHTWKNDISLAEEDIATILAWVDQGAKRGNPKDLPAVPKFHDGWKLGTPDQIIILDEVAVPADGDDLFLKQYIDLKFEDDKWIKSIEFMPGDRRVVHHIQTTYKTTNGSKHSSGAGSIGGILAIWTAGMPPFEFPDGVGRPIGKAARILVDSHYHPMGEATTDQTKIGLYFGEGELEKEVATLAVTNTGIRIPPGAANHMETSFNVLDTDMKIVAFSPHMHLRGKSMKYDLVLPDGSRETLLNVPKYNYNWQWQYYPEEPIDAPAGSRIEVTAAWDNSAGNPANPDPTEEILYRGDTFHEMFVGFVEVIPKNTVYHETVPNAEKVKKLLAAHPAEDSYFVAGFLPFGFYAPKEGKGMMYLAQGLNMFTITLDEIEWDGDHLRLVTQLPTPEASATISIFEGDRDAEGNLRGTFQYGVDAPRTLNVPSIAKSMTLIGV
jgi:mono/diheme cytochrome c family protein